MSIVDHIDEPIRLRQRISATLAQRMQFNLMGDKPITCRIEGISARQMRAFALEMTVRDRARPKSQPNRVSWAAWFDGSQTPSSAGHPQLATLQMRRDINSFALWEDIRETFGLAVECTTGVTVVGNVIKDRSGHWEAPMHWHAPPVINVQIFGSARKEYKFVAFQHVTEALRCKSRLSEGDFVPTHTATIGRDERANCIMFPAQMLHFIRTLPGSTPYRSPPRSVQEANTFFASILNKLGTADRGAVEPLLNEVVKELRIAANDDEEDVRDMWLKKISELPSTRFTWHAFDHLVPCGHENSSKSLYLGFGTYMLFQDDRFIRHALGRLITSASYAPWLEQLDRNPTTAIKLHNKIIANWTAVGQNPAANVAPVYIDEDVAAAPVAVAATGTAAAASSSTGGALAVGAGVAGAWSKRTVRITPPMQGTPAGAVGGSLASVAEDVARAASIAHDARTSGAASCSAGAFGPLAPLPIVGVRKKYNTYCYNCSALLESGNTLVVDWCVGCDYKKKKCQNWACIQCAGLTSDADRVALTEGTEEWLCHTHGWVEYCYMCKEPIDSFKEGEYIQWSIGCDHKDGRKKCKNWSCARCAGVAVDYAGTWFCNIHQSS